MVKQLFILTGLFLAIAGCSLSGGKSNEGHTFDELMDGVKADPAHYEISHECVESDESLNGRIFYNVEIKLTNTDTRQRSFQAWIKDEQIEDPRRVPLEWQRPNQTIEFDASVGWKDDFPNGCPDYTVDVYQNPAEALVEGDN